MKFATIAALVFAVSAAGDEPVNPTKCSTSEQEDDNNKNRIEKCSTAEGCLNDE